MGAEFPKPHDFVYFLPSNTSVTPVTVGGNLILTKPTDNSVDIGGPQFTIVSVNGTQIIVSVKAIHKSLLEKNDIKKIITTHDKEYIISLLQNKIKIKK